MWWLTHTKTNKQNYTTEVKTEAEKWDGVLGHYWIYYLENWHCLINSKYLSPSRVYEINCLSVSNQWRGQRWGWRGGTSETQSTHRVYAYEFWQENFQGCYLQMGTHWGPGRGEGDCDTVACHYISRVPAVWDSLSDIPMSPGDKWPSAARASLWWLSLVPASWGGWGSSNQWLPKNTYFSTENHLLPIFPFQFSNGEVFNSSWRTKAFSVLIADYCVSCLLLFQMVEGERTNNIHRWLCSLPSSFSIGISIFISFLVLNF